MISLRASLCTVWLGSVAKSGFSKVRTRRCYQGEFGGVVQRRIEVEEGTKVRWGLAQRPRIQAIYHETAIQYVHDEMLHHL